MSQETASSQKVKRHPNDLIFIQSRAEINEAIVEEYAAMMADGVIFDPVEGLQDESGAIFIHDGQHRGEAAKKVDTILPVNLRPGSQTEAEWLALTANQKHGLRRTRADKQHVVRKALLHPNGASLTDRKISRHCGVDHKTVGKIRRELETTGEIPQLSKRRVQKATGETYEIDTTNIGSQPSIEPAQPQPPPMSPADASEMTTGSAFFAAAETDLPPPDDAAWEETQPFVAGDAPSPPPARERPTKPSRAQRPDASQPQLATYDHTVPALPEQSSHLQQPKQQEFECPRCGQERIVGVNGSRRWCLNCLAEWPPGRRIFG